MSLRNTTPRQRRISEYHAFLGSLAQRQLPWVCEAPADIEKLLALHGAALVQVSFDATHVARDGSRHIARAVVSGITPEGRAVMYKTAQAPLRVLGMPGPSLGTTG